MSFRKIRILNITSVAFILLFYFTNPINSQKNYPPGADALPNKFKIRQDSTSAFKKRSIQVAEPDTNFTWERYAAFLNKISDTSKYIVLPLNEFRQTFNSKKIVIGLRHDIDNDLGIAYKFSQIESDLGFRSTYFILHTAPYYLANSNNMEVHSNEIIPVLKKMQNEKHFEIGWHNDLVTLQVIYNINPVTYFHKELNWLRSNGLHIIGTAAHGSTYCKTYHYMNFYFFEECTFPVVTNRENNISVPKDGKLISLIKGKLSDFDLKYEAYFLNNNKAYSDATVTNGIRWNIGMLDLNQLQPGDRTIILLHPVHWHKASVRTNIEYFSIRGQKSCVIDSLNSRIIVEMPYGTDKSSLVASFALSPGAYVKVSGRLQFSRSSSNNFINPVTYRVYAENRAIQKDWIIEVHYVKIQANFISYSVPGLIGKANIDTLKNTITADIDEKYARDTLKPSFVLSDDSHAWIGNQEQKSGLNFVNFTHPVVYNVISKDSQIIKKWKVTLNKRNTSKNEKPYDTDLLIYPNPSAGKTHIQFAGVKTSPTTLNIYNTFGEKVLTHRIKQTGDFTIEENLKQLGGGVFLVRYSEVEKPELIVIKQH